MAIATAAKQIMVDGMQVTVGAGQENISAVQARNLERALARAGRSSVIQRVPHAYMPMLQTAEHVAKRYGISRDAQDAYALQSQLRTAAAQRSGLFETEIVPVTAQQLIKDKQTGEVSNREVTLKRRTKATARRHAWRT